MRTGSHAAGPGPDADSLQRGIGPFWDEHVLPALQEFIRIPNESPAFDPDWRDRGHMERAAALAADWVRRHAPAGTRADVLHQGERTPLLLVEVPGEAPGTALLYGHLDKQPPMHGWREGLDAWTPVLDDQGRLYGRGGADDGYAVFASLAALRALRAGGQPHGRVVMVVECSEESGSPDLPAYLEAAADRIGRPDLVVCLDSGCGDYERLWATTSLRGMVSATLRVEVLSEGVHSGMAGGVVPSPVRIARQLLDRLEDSRTGDLLPPALRVEIPGERREQAHRAAEVLGERALRDFPLLAGVQPEARDVTEAILRSSWHGSLAVTGVEGLPGLAQAGNVVVPAVSLRLALRIPPTLDPQAAGRTVREVLERDPPCGARVSVSTGGMPGWHAPPMADWLAAAVERGSRECFGQAPGYLGVGGSIPFVDMMGRQFPDAQFLITGVLGPHSNAHGPNEFLHVPYAKRLTGALARILAGHGAASR